MKIIIIGASGFDSLEFHLKDSLFFLGHEVEILDLYKLMPIPQKYGYWLNYISDSYSQKMARKLSNQTLERDPDLVIVTYRNIHPAFVNGLKKDLNKVPIIHFNPDALTGLKNQQIFASEYDFYFSKDRFMVHFMRNKMKLNAFYLPECFNQRYCESDFSGKAEAEDKIQIDVLVYGNFYPYRNRMLEILIKNGINLKLCGNIGPYFPKSLKDYYLAPIYGKDKVNYIFGSKIVFNNFHYAEIQSVNEKYFVINGCGGFQLCDYREVLSEYSQVPSESYSSLDIDDAIKKITYYLSNSPARNEIATAQREHFLNNHTYDIRMTQMLNTIFQ